MIGQLLKKSRQKNKMSTRQVEGHLKIGGGLVSKYENDKVMPSFDTVIKMARLYGLEIIKLARCVK